MSIGKKQLQRLLKIVAQLKENRYPNCNTLVEDFRRLDIENNMNIACSAKTIRRDIKTLQDDFNCPVEFDWSKNGYFLKHHGWDFDYPELLEEHEMLAMVLGARLAEEIFPEPLRSKIREAVDYLLTNNNPDFLDTASLKSLIVATKLNICIKPDIFLAVFDAWKNHEIIEIKYEAPDCKISRRHFEPHVMTFYDQSWYINGICLMRNAIRTFAVHRIKEVLPQGEYFEPDQKLIERVAKGNFLEYKMIENIEVKCVRELKSYLLAKPFHPKQNIIELNSQHFLLQIPAVPEHEILNWIMYQSGKAKLIKPGWLVKKIKKTADLLSKMHFS